VVDFCVVFSVFSFFSFFGFFSFFSSFSSTIKTASPFLSLSTATFFNLLIVVLAVIAAEVLL